MAENKNSFLMYTDFIHTLEKVPNEQAGMLFKHILRYVNDKFENDLEAVTGDLVVDVVFEPLKQQLKRDLKKWRSEADKNSESGSMGNLKRWHTDLYEKVVASEMTLDEAIQVTRDRKIAKSSGAIAKIAVSVTDSVSVTVTDTVKTKNIPKETGVSLDFDNLLLYINKTLGRKFKLINKSVKQSFNARLKDGYTNADIKTTIDNLATNPYHKENGYQYCTPEFISRSATLEKYSQKISLPGSTQQQTLTLGKQS